MKPTVSNATCDIHVPISPEWLRWAASTIEASLSQIDLKAVHQPSPKISVRLSPGIVLVTDPKNLVTLPMAVGTEQ